MSSILRERRKRIDLESLAGGIILTATGAISIYISEKQLSIIDYLVIIVALCGTIIMFNLRYKYNIEILRRKIVYYILFFLLLVALSFIVESAPIVGSSILIGIGIGFLVYGSPFI